MKIQTHVHVIQTNCTRCHGKLRAVRIMEGLTFFCFRIGCPLCSLRIDLLQQR